MLLVFLVLKPGEQLEPVKVQTKNISREEELIISQKDFREVEQEFESASYNEMIVKAATMQSYSVVYDDTEEYINDEVDFSQEQIDRICEILDLK